MSFPNLTLAYLTTQFDFRLNYNTGCFGSLILIVSLIETKLPHRVSADFSSKIHSYFQPNFEVSRKVKAQLFIRNINFTLLKWNSCDCCTFYLENCCKTIFNSMSHTYRSPKLGCSCLSFPKIHLFVARLLKSFTLRYFSWYWWIFSILSEFSKVLMGLQNILGSVLVIWNFPISLKWDLTIYPNI